MIRKVNYSSKAYRTSLPLEVVKLLGIGEKDEILYKISRRGKVTITKVIKGEESAKDNSK